GFGKRQARRPAAHDAADRRPVRLAEIGHAEQLAEGRAGHALKLTGDAPAGVYRHPPRNSATCCCSSAGVATAGSSAAPTSIPSREKILRRARIGRGSPGARLNAE